MFMWQPPSERVVRDSEEARRELPLEIPILDALPADVARRILSELSASGYHPGNRYRNPFPKRVSLLKLAHMVDRPEDRPTTL
jgi:hypothetical protein